MSIYLIRLLYQLNSCPRSSVWIEQRFPKPLVARSSRAGGMIREVKPKGYKLLGFLFRDVKMIKRAQNFLKYLVDRYHIIKGSPAKMSETF